MAGGNWHSSSGSANQLAMVMILTNRALEHGHLSFDDLAPVADTAQTEAARRLCELRTFLELHGGEGRYEEGYEELRGAVCVHLDLLGVSPGASIEILERAQNFEDARVALFPSQYPRTRWSSPH